MATEKKPDQEGRAPSAWQVREARRRRSSMINKVIGVVILGGIVGLAIVKRDDIARIYNDYMNPKPPQITKAPPPPPPPVEKPVEKIPPPVEKPPETKSVPPPPKVVAPPEPVVSAADQQAARKLIDDGKKLLDNFGYAKAAAKFNEAAKKQIGRVMHAEAESWGNRATAYDDATRHISFADYATAETAYIVQTYDSGEWRGLKRSENAQHFVLQAILPDNPAAEGRQSFPIEREQIAKITPISLEERKTEFRQLVAGQERGQTFQKSTDFYDVVYLSKRLSLGPNCLGYLNRAYDGEASHKPDPYLGDNFRKVVISRAIDRAALQSAAGRKQLATDTLNRLVKTLPGYQVAVDEVEAFKVQVMSKVKDDYTPHITFKEAPSGAVASAQPAKRGGTQEETPQRRPDEEGGDFVVNSGGIQGSGAAGPIVEKANAKYEDGMRLYRGYRQGTTGNNNKTLEDALARLTEAVDLYDQALKLEPGNKAISDRQIEANMIAYACRKYHTL